MHCGRKIVLHECIELFSHQVESQLNLNYFGPFSFYQMTPLHLAVEINRFKMVEFLLDQGAHINLQDDIEVTYICIRLLSVSSQALYPCIVHFLSCLKIRFSSSL